MKRKSTLRHHLIVAVISTGVLIYWIASLLGRSLDHVGSVSFGSSWRGMNYSVVEPMTPLLGLALCSVFSWLGFFEDRRLAKKQDEEPENPQDSDQAKSNQDIHPPLHQKK
ncbi:MAG: hypothetical protein V4689_23600 [Verrucomicrobiota bacterium]